MVSSWVATLLQRGLVIPVERDPATGALTKVAPAQLTQELSDRRGEADAIRPKSALDPDVQAVIDLPRDVRKAIKDRAHRGSLEPTEGAIPPPQQPARPQQRVRAPKPWRASRGTPPLRWRPTLRLTRPRLQRRPMRPVRFMASFPVRGRPSVLRGRRALRLSRV